MSNLLQGIFQNLSQVPTVLQQRVNVAVALKPQFVTAVETALAKHHMTLDLGHKTFWKSRFIAIALPHNCKACFALSAAACCRAAANAFGSVCQPPI